MYINLLVHVNIVLKMKLSGVKFHFTGLDFRFFRALVQNVIGVCIMQTVLNMLFVLNRFFIMFLRFLMYLICKGNL